MSIIKKSFLIFNALHEYGDVTVLNNDNNKINYSELKSKVKIPLISQKDEIVKKYPNFQTMAFKRENKKDEIHLMRSKISGRSIIKTNKKEDIFRKVTVFEIYILNKNELENLGEEEFLDLIKSLDFKYYPKPPIEGEPGIEKPINWYVPESFSGYKKIVNKKWKEYFKYNKVDDWEKESERGIEKLLWYMWKNSKVVSGINVCFTVEDFNEYDICNYYHDKYSLSHLKYKLLTCEGK